MTAASRAASLSAVAALLLAAVWFLWPAALGGGATFVSTHGSSMQPRFSTGDLAVLRAADSYAVGDVVAYRSESLDTVVMHRIVSGDANGFVTQGDNNDWLDEDRPADDEILGRLFVRIPAAGKVIDAARAPGALPFAAAAGIGVLGLAHRPRARRGSRAARRRRPAFSLPSSGGFSTLIRARARQISVACGAVALLAATGLGVLLSLPATQTDVRTLHVLQQGQFSYTGTAVAGTTYPTGVLATGDTVWTRLARQVTVSFTDTVGGPGVADLHGALRLDVVLAAADGWSAVLATGPVAALEGGTATARVVVDPEQAATLLRRHLTEIGTPGGTATLTVTPVAQTTGTAEGRAFTAGAPAGLAFTMDAASLRPAGKAEAALAPTLSTPVEVEEATPRRLQVLSAAVPVGIARIVAAVVLAVALLALGAAAWVGRSDRKDVADQFLVRHADRILPVASLAPGAAVVDVVDAESLHRVAERFDTLVLHHAAPEEDVFVVRDVDMTYRFVVPGSPDRRRGRPPVPPPQVPAVADPTVPLPRVAPLRSSFA
jgi:signal peptidase I